MTAADTALRILCWAATDVHAAIPEGDLTDAVRLAEPDRDTLRSIGRLASVTAARLRLAAPLLGDQRPPGLTPAVVAAAIGAFRHGDQTRTVLGAVRAPTRAADLLALHGLVAPSADRLPELGDQLRDLSPLTGVLDRPGPRTAAACETLLDRMVEDPAARTMLVSRFAAPPDTPAQSRWRGECLAYLRHEVPDFVVDVYVTAWRHFGDEHELRARTAWRHVLGPGSAEPARPTALWWRALAELESAEPRRLHGLTALDRRRVGTNLYRRLEGDT